MYNNFTTIIFKTLIYALRRQKRQMLLLLFVGVGQTPTTITEERSV